MSKAIKILGVPGSLRRTSFNRSLLRAAAGLLPEGASLEICDIDGIPGFSEDDEMSPPPKVFELKQRIRAADAILFATPEYNYSVPGVLKNAIDWASRPHGDSAWLGKPAAIMGATVGTLGTARAQYHLRQILVFLDVHAVNKPEVMIGQAGDRFDAEGNLTDEVTKRHIRDLLSSLVDWARRLGPASQRRGDSQSGS